MKIRTGFVSNSSTSSFLILGYKFNKEELIELYNNHKTDSDDVLRDDFGTNEIAEYIEYLSIFTKEEQKLLSSFVFMYDTDYAIIGAGTYGDEEKSFSIEQMQKYLDTIKIFKEKLQIKKEPEVFFGAEENR